MAAACQSIPELLNRSLKGWNEETCSNLQFYEWIALIKRALLWHRYVVIDWVEIDRLCG